MRSLKHCLWEGFPLLLSFKVIPIRALVQLLTSPMYQAELPVKQTQNFFLLCELVKMRTLYGHMVEGEALN